MAEIEKNSEEEFAISLHFADNPGAKRLLDALVAILADEYIQTARENPEIFT